MTVAELITKLQTMPQDVIVTAYDMNAGEYIEIVQCDMGDDNKVFVETIEPYVA